MKHLSGPFVTASLVLFVFGATHARADMIGWSYSWSRTPLSVAADGAGTGGINLTVNPGGPIVGTSDIVAVNLSSFSSAPAGTTDVFTNKPYTLTLALTDTASKQTGIFSFGGTLSGTLSPTLAQISNAFDGPTTQQKVLGHNLYTVSLNPFAPPGLPTSTTLGGISAHVTVTPEAGTSPGVDTSQSDPGTTTPAVHNSPEPSTLVLAGLTVPVLGAARWWRRRSLALRLA